MFITTVELIFQLNQYIFEETFNLRFAVTFTQHNTTLSAVYKNLLNDEELEKVKRINALDIELYEFAKHHLFRYFINQYFLTYVMIFL